MNQMGATGQGMSRDAKVRAMSKREYDVEDLGSKNIIQAVVQVQGRKEE